MPTAGSMAIGTFVHPDQGGPSLGPRKESACESNDVI